MRCISKPVLHVLLTKCVPSANGMIKALGQWKRKDMLMNGCRGIPLSKGLIETCDIEKNTCCMLCTLDPKHQSRHLDDRKRWLPQNICCFQQQPMSLAQSVGWNALHCQTCSACSSHKMCSKCKWNDESTWPMKAEGHAPGWLQGYPTIQWSEWNLRHWKKHVLHALHTRSQAPVSPLGRSKEMTPPEHLLLSTTADVFGPKCWLKCAALPNLFCMFFSQNVFQVQMEWLKHLANESGRTCSWMAAGVSHYPRVWLKPATLKKTRAACFAH